MSTSYEQINDAIQFIDPTERDVWLRMAMAIKSELGDSGNDIWLEWGQQADSFNEKDAQSVWKSIRPDGRVTIASLFHLAKSSGWKNSGFSNGISPEELEERQRVSKERINQEKADIAADREKAATNAKALINASSAATSDNSYLKLKGVQAVNNLYEIDARVAAQIIGYTPKSGGDPLEGRLLVVPITKGSEISSVELIDGKKRKTALAGRGTKTGGFWASGALPDQAGDFTVLIGEGVATVLSASEAAEHIGIAALSSSNLVAVAKLTRERYPRSSIVILADLERVTGDPDSHAFEAAKVSKAKLAIPDFGNQRLSAHTDFNDLYLIAGRVAVQACIESAKEVDDEDLANSSNEWQQPIPLINDIEPDPYPLDALPTVIREAVQEVQGFVQAPVAMVATSALSVLSFVSQGLYDVTRAEKLIGPISLFSMVIAESGERKTSCDDFFMPEVRKWENQQEEKMRPEIQHFEAAIASWQAEKEGIQNSIKQNIKKGESIYKENNDLGKLHEKKPQPPRVPRLIYSDITPEELGYKLAKSWPTASISSSEGGSVLGSHGMTGDSAMRNMARLNDLWSGQSIQSDRRTAESWKIQCARLTVGLQVQESTLRTFFEKSGGLARGTGFLARFLFAWPESTQGTRFFKEPPHNWPKLDIFNKRLAQILDTPISISEEGSLITLALPFDPEAKLVWREYHDEVEKSLKTGGSYADIRDIAAKSADNAARLAALFHVFDYGSKAISKEAMTSGCFLAAWHLHESKRFFNELSQPESISDSLRLIRWMKEHFQLHGFEKVTFRDLHNRSPVREKSRLTNALQELQDTNHLKQKSSGKSKLIYLNPALLKGGGI